MRLKFLTIFLLIGCTISREEWKHPMKEKLPPEESITHRIDLAQNRLDLVQDFFDPTEIKRSVEINENTEIEDEFYQPQPKVDVDKEGNIYIVHRQSSTIHVYDQKGKLQYKIGKGGRGPGEFLRIMTFVLDDDKDVLYILGWYKIEIFKKEQGTYQQFKTVPIKFFRTFDMCKLDDNLFISGARYFDLSDQSVSRNILNPIHKINMSEFKVDTSFGFKYESVTKYPAFGVKLSEMLLSCNEKTKTLTAFQRHFPFIFGYDSNGNQRWVSKLDSYLNYEFTEFKDPKYKNPGMMPHSNEGLFQRKYYPRTLKNTTYALVQLSHFKPQVFFGDPDKVPIPEINYRSILVNTETGELLNSDNYDLIMYKDDSTVITVDNTNENFEHKFIRHEF